MKLSPRPYPIKNFFNAQLNCSQKKGTEKNIRFNVRFSLTLLPYHQLISPLKNRSNSDWRTFQPFPALMALIFLSRQYFKNVGLDIFRYLVACLVVKTVFFFSGIRSRILSLFLHNFDRIVKSPEIVTPAKAGVQNYLKSLDSCFRRNDKTG